MSIFLRHILAATVSGALASSAMAHDGTINFTGEVTSVSCSLKAGAGSSVTGSQGSTKVEVAMGKISADAVPATGNAANSAYINLTLDCGNTAPNLTTVEMRFDPLSGSGLDTFNNTLLKVKGGATGVAIGIYDQTANKLLNLAANDILTSALTTAGTGATSSTTGIFNMRAAYLANGDAVVPGIANAELPFTLTYK